MALLRIDDPAVEPISLEQARLHLRLDTSDDDTLVASLITAARTHVEQLVGQALITQTWMDVRDRWPVKGSTVKLPFGPVQDVVDVRVLDQSGDVDTVPAETYFLDRVDDPARLCPVQFARWPNPGRVINGIEIEFVAGYGDTADDVPHPLRQALLLLIAHWYEQREPVSVGTSVADIPQTVAGLLAPYRRRQVA